MNQNNNELKKAVIERWKMPASQVAITFARHLGEINGDKMETGSMSAKYCYRLQKSLLKAIISGELRAREHITGEYLEPGHDAYSDGDIDLQDFCNWANKAGFIGVPDDGLKLAAAFGLPREAYLSESQQALLLKIQATTSPTPETQTAPVGAVGASGGVVTDKAAQIRPLQRTAAQDNAIICEIKKQGYDPLALPKNPNGKSGVKASIRTALSGNELFVGSTIFNKAWIRLAARADIVIQK